MPKYGKYRKKSPANIRPVSELSNVTKKSPSPGPSVCHINTTDMITNVWYLHYTKRQSDVTHTRSGHGKDACVTLHLILCLEL